MRPWCLTCGQDVAHQRRRRRPRPGDTWPLDAVFLTINGARHDLWRAVDQDGTGRDRLGQPRRHKKAATQCCRTLLNGGHDVPRVRVTEQLKRDGAAKRAVWPSVEPRSQRALNKRAEHAPQPTRQPERRMQGFTAPGHAQRFRSVSGPIAPYFRPRRHLFPAPEYRQELGKRCHPWQEITSLPTAA
jgi:putative transposase